MKNSLAEKVWWDYLEEDLQELLHEAFLLAKIAEGWSEHFHDYSFVVFPAAKAYEGFLKKMFLDLRLISSDDYFGKRFRVGKALNPALDKKYAHESVYNKLISFCGDKALADELWETWKRCRNLLFHWFPEEKRAISLSEAKQRLSMIIDAIDKAFLTCKIKDR